MIKNLIDKEYIIREIIKVAVEHELDIKAIGTCIYIIQNAPFIKHTEA